MEDEAVLDGFADLVPINRLRGFAAVVFLADFVISGGGPEDDIRDVSKRGTQTDHWPR
jgi:hypothetical protein